MVGSPSSGSSVAHWGSLLCLLALFAQLALAAPLLSLTYDEPLYTAAGYADLVTGNFRWHEVIGHGALLNVLAAWPLLLGEHRPDPLQFSEWNTDNLLGFSRTTLSALGDLATIAWVTRIPIMWLTVLLAAYVARWAGQLWGRRAGLLALFAFAFEPNLLAHGQLNTTDMGVTAFGFLSAYLLARYLRAPSWKRYLGAGLALGAALASKTSGHFWLGAYGLIVFLVWLRGAERRPGGRVALRALALWSLRLAGWVAIALLTLWATYGFEVRSVVPGGLPVPMASHWLGLGYQRSNVTVGQTTFLAGELKSGGRWAYFPLAFVLKTPLPLLVALLVSIGLSLRRPRMRRSMLPLLVPPLIYSVLSLAAGLNIGYRHLLPVLPFLSLGVGRLAAPGVLPLQRKGRLWLIIPLLVWYVVGSLLLFPHYLAYFNELAGGPGGGYRYFVDSTLEWGQGFYALQDYLEAQGAGEEKLRLSAFSSLDPTWYGLEFLPLPPTPGEDVPLGLDRRFDPAPGRYVLSVTPLQGVWILDPDTYDWFRHRSPAARVGHVLWIYDVPPDPDPPERVVQCATPLPPLDAAALEEGFGHADLRSDPFDCTQSWLYPGEDGWIVLPGAEVTDDWLLERLDGLPLIFRQREHWQHPAASIYEQRQLAVGSIPSQTRVQIAPTEWQLDRALAEGASTAAPLSMEGPLDFLGYEVESLSNSIELHTYWRVTAPSARPLSLMAHLLDATGRPVAVADGLGVPVTSALPGDVIVQRHRFLDQEPLVGSYWIQTGAYWLDTLERWPVIGGEQIIGDRILLVEVSW